MRYAPIVSAAVFVLTPLVAAAPMKLAAGFDTVAGLGAHKKTITAVGGTDLNLAVAMMGTGDSFSAVSGPLCHPPTLS